MKNLIILTVIFSGLLLISCEKEIEKEEVNTDYLLFKSDVSKVGIAINLRLWRKSTNCFSRLGICFIERKVIEPGTKLTNINSRDNVIITVNETDTNITLLLSTEVSGLSNEDLLFDVEEELILELDDKSFKIPKGIYQYNENLGEFGGYNIAVSFD